MTLVQRELQRMRRRYPELLDNDRMWPRFIAAVDCMVEGRSAVAALAVGGPLERVELVALLLVVAETVASIERGGPITPDREFKRAAALVDRVARSAG